jgi:hypothetical protein
MFSNFWLIIAFVLLTPFLLSMRRKRNSGINDEGKVARRFYPALSIEPIVPFIRVSSCPN